MRAPLVRVLVVTTMASWLIACENVCDEVAEEAEASGCAQPAPEDGVSEEEATCEGDRERRAQCLLDFTDNVCFPTDGELQAVEACMAEPPGGDE